MSVRFVELERLTRVAPFGVRFWDPATQTQVGAGLSVTGMSLPASSEVRAVMTPSSVYVLQGLPGMGDAERGSGEASYWTGAGPPTHSLLVRVADPQGQFLPVTFEAEAPHWQLVDAGCSFVGSPPWHPVWVPPAAPTGLSPPGPGDAPRWVPVVPLFSAPARPAPAGMAVVRAQLELAPASSPGGGAPASWAALELTPPGGPPVIGVADGNGLATVMFAWPEPPALQLSPPSPTIRPLSAQTWTIGVRAYFGSGSLPALAPVAAPDGVPDLCDLLRQHPATLLQDGSTPLVSVPLRYGQETVARTLGLSVLLLAPAGLP
ncbi:MAG: hypothetical protein QOH66_1545 [Actinomycetota bacterium]|jgi:hypothetical protein|nr:hypothetical protein [Actinomycetota bacterium]